MTLARLVGAFETFTVLPIEIPEVRDALIALGIQDHIVCVGGDFDPRQLQGTFYQFRHQQILYGDAQQCSLIIYSTRLPLEWQRVVCCKELIHILDSAAGRTDTPEEVEALVEKLLGPLSTEDFGMADLQALKDKLALYQALAILFPDDARTAILELNPRPTPQEVALWACLPVQLVSLVLSEEWPAMIKGMLKL